MHKAQQKLEILHLNGDQIHTFCCILVYSAQKPLIHKHQPMFIEIKKKTKERFEGKRYCETVAPTINMLLRRNGAMEGIGSSSNGKKRRDTLNYKNQHTI